MATPIAFYFDFSSPYGYIASHLVDALGARHGRTVTWRPILLGTIFRAIGSSPLVNQPLKGDYAKLDFARSARLHGVPFELPARFPTPSRAAGAAFYAIDAHDPGLACTFAKRVYGAYFTQGVDINSAEVVSDLAAEAGVERARLAADLPEGNARLDGVTSEAKDLGVFGSPFFIVDGEPFWGADRIDMLDRWLATGGW